MKFDDKIIKAEREIIEFGLSNIGRWVIVALLFALVLVVTIIRWIL